MATIAQRKAAQLGDVRVLLKLIDKGEVSSIGDDNWRVYDETRPEGYHVTNGVELLIERKLAQPKGYYDICLTESGTKLLAELNAAKGGHLTTECPACKRTVGLAGGVLKRHRFEGRWCEAGTA